MYIFPNTWHCTVDFRIHCSHGNSWFAPALIFEWGHHREHDDDDDDDGDDGDDDDDDEISRSPPWKTPTELLQDFCQWKYPLDSKTQNPVACSLDLDKIQWFYQTKTNTTNKDQHNLKE